jgi:hypothetical protein
MQLIFGARRGYTIAEGCCWGPSWMKLRNTGQMQRKKIEWRKERKI